MSSIARHFRMCLLVLLTSTPAWGADKGAEPSSPSRTAAAKTPDDSDLPKPFKFDDDETKGVIPAFLGIFGPASLLEQSGFTSSPGKWIEYDLVPFSSTGKTGGGTMRYQEVGSAPRGRRWIELIVTTNDMGVAALKMLVAGEEDGNVERMIAKSPYMPPIEFPLESMSMTTMPAGLAAAGGPDAKLTKKGREKVKVPLGTFEADHWVFRNGGLEFDFWVAVDKSIPFTRAIKFTTENGVAIATKVGVDAKAFVQVPGAAKTR